MDEKELIYDFNAITQFIFNSNDDEIVSEISEQYARNEVEEMDLLGKTITETKGSKDSNEMTMRYDLLKYFMSIINDIEYGNNLTFGQKLALNSFFAQGFVKECK